MSGQVLLRGDLASQWPSPFQSCRALLYLRIRRCLAKPLYCLAFYLKEKADLAPVALSLSVSLSVRLSVSLMCLFFHPSVYLSVTSTALPLSPLLLSLSLLSFISSSLTLHSSSATRLSSRALSSHTHPHTQVQHICLASDMCECMKLMAGRNVLCDRATATFTLPPADWSVITSIHPDTQAHSHTHTSAHTVQYKPHMSLTHWASDHALWSSIHIH